MSFLWKIGRPFIFKLDPETAHGLAIANLQMGLNKTKTIIDPCLNVTVAGLHFQNPVGMAAGFDKNAKVADAVLKLGFGHTEIGTVTPLPQDGNPRPRLFRLIEDQGVINRMGFNNEGHEAAYKRLVARKRQGIVGVNIGANKMSENRINDYVKGITRFFEVADYFTINISSPNTPGLRDLQARDSLHELIEAVINERTNRIKGGAGTVPVFLKIAPDMSEKGLDDIAEEVLVSKLDGLIVSNTTISRTNLKDKKYAMETGGLSGRPLFERSTIILAKMRKRIGNKLPIIGVGGISDGQTALEKIRAGADLVQLYSCMVYEGPDIAGDILNNLIAACKKDGVKSITEYRDQTIDKWANQSIPA